MQRLRRCVSGDQAIGNQAEEIIIRTAEAPTQVQRTLGAEDDLPGTTGKPSMLPKKRARRTTAGGHAVAVQGIRNACGIGAYMPPPAVPPQGRAGSGDRRAADATQQILRRRRRQGFGAGALRSPANGRRTAAQIVAHDGRQTRLTPLDRARR